MKWAPHNKLVKQLVLFPSPKEPYGDRGWSTTRLFVLIASFRTYPPYIDMAVCRISEKFTKHTVLGDDVVISCKKWILYKNHHIHVRNEYYTKKKKTPCILGTEMDTTEVGTRSQVFYMLLWGWLIELF